jgi:hypothetical protein
MTMPAMSGLLASVVLKIASPGFAFLLKAPRHSGVRRRREPGIHNPGLSVKYTGSMDSGSPP